MKYYRAPDNTLHCLDDDVDPKSIPIFPIGCIEITRDEADLTLQNSSTRQERVALVLLGMKSKRLDIFRVLDTLQVDALTSSDQPRAQAIMQAKAALTALNNIDLSAYQTSEQMEQAIQQAYWGIVSQAPQEVQDVFNALVPR